MTRSDSTYQRAGTVDCRVDPIQNREQVMIFDMNDQAMGQNLETFRTELLRHSDFVSAAASGETKDEMDNEAGS